MCSSSHSLSHFPLLIQSGLIALGIMPPTFKADLPLYLILPGKALTDTYAMCLINDPVFLL